MYRIDLLSIEYVLVISLVEAEVERAEETLQLMKGTSVVDIFERDLATRKQLLAKLKTSFG